MPKPIQPELVMSRILMLIDNPSLLTIQGSTLLKLWHQNYSPQISIILANSTKHLQPKTDTKRHFSV